MHIHILGICGTFMGGIAAIAKEAGHHVTGCDANVYPPMSDQLRALGIGGRAEPGGVAWEGTAEEVYRANLWLRTASRVVVRVGTFRARTFFELERHAKKLPWERWVARGRSVRLRVTSKKSKLYHEGAVAERLLGWIGERVGEQACVRRHGMREVCHSAAHNASTCATPLAPSG